MLFIVALDYSVQHMPYGRLEASYYHPWCQHQVSSIFFLRWIILWVTNTKYKYGSTYTIETVSIYDSSNIPTFNHWELLNLLRVYYPILILCYFLTSTLMSPSHLKFWIVGSLQYWVLYFLCSGRGVLPCIQYEALFFYLSLTKRLTQKWYMLPV